MNRSCLLLITALCAAPALRGATQSFDFKDPKGVNHVTFTLDAPLESISGSASGIAGSVVFDPDKPSAVRGKIVVETASLHVPNPMMKDHLHGAQWLDVAAYPEIVFEARSVSQATTSGDTTTAQVTGNLTLRGVTRDMTIPVKFTYLKDKLAARTNGRTEGDLLVIRANFIVKRSDFGINPGAPQDKVADDIHLGLSIAGAAPR